MKNLKKFVALFLAGALALLMLTACGGSGAGETDAQKTQKVFNTVSGGKQAATVSVNDPALQKVAEDHLNEDLKTSIDFFGAQLFGKVHVEGKDQQYLTITVTAKYQYGPFLKAFLDAVQSEIGREFKDTGVNIKGDSSWVKLGVVVKTDGSRSYMAVAFKILNPKYGK